MAPEKIVVTGAGGFLGRHVLSALAGPGVTISALCGDEAEREGIEKLAAHVAVGDILDTGLLDSRIRGADAVVHLAGPPFVRESFERPLDYARIHVLGTVAVLEACRAQRVRRLVYVSSAEVYGRSAAERVDENQPLCPLSPYGAAKASAERFIESMLAGGPSSAVMLRPFSIYGPGAPDGALVPTILRQAVDAPRIELANLAPIRDYCYVSDVAVAVKLALTVDIPGTSAVNIGSGEGTSVRHLAERALEVVGRRIPIAQAAASDRPADADVDRLVADVRRAESLLGWRPRVSLREGLARICDGLRTNTSLRES